MQEFYRNRWGAYIPVRNFSDLRKNRQVQYICIPHIGRQRHIVRWGGIRTVFAKAQGKNAEYVHKSKKKRQGHLQPRAYML